MKTITRQIYKILMATLAALWIFSCATPSVELSVGYCLPADGERVLYLSGSHGGTFLEPLSSSMGVEDYKKIEPLLEQTDKFYLVTRGEELYIQGEGNYEKGWINFFLGANRDWKKERRNGFKTYRSESTGLEIVFPDSTRMLMSQGNLLTLLETYAAGGSREYPFDRTLEAREALLMTMDLTKGNLLPMQDMIKIPFTGIDVALSPENSDGEILLMDVTLRGEEGNGKLLGSSLRLFLLATVGRDAIKADLVTEDSYAGVIDLPVTLDFLLDLTGL